MTEIDVEATNTRRREELVVRARAAMDELDTIVAELRELGSAVSADRAERHGVSSNVNVPADRAGLMHMIESGQRLW